MSSFPNMLENSLTEECTCGICMDIWNDPLQLPCQHTFCRACLITYAKVKPSYDFKCPMCNTIHKLKQPGDISIFPTDKFAMRVVAMLKSQNADMMRKPALVDPAIAAAASAPPFEPEEAAPQPNNIHPTYVNSPADSYAAPPLLQPGQAVPSAPPMELFDPPPKQSFSPSNPYSNNPPNNPYASLNQSSSNPYAAPPQGYASQSATSSAQPPALPPRASPSMNTGTPMPDSGKATPPPLPSRLNQSNGNLAKSSMAASSSSTPPPSTVNPLGLSRAPHSSRRKRAAPIEMPPGLQPPRSMMLQECRPLFDMEEIWMPFVIPESEVQPTWAKWMKTLWFLQNIECAELKAVSHMLCPAWRVAGDLTIHFSASATINVAKSSKGQVASERHRQSGSIKLENYVSMVCGVTSDTPFAPLMGLCVLSDALPMQDSPSFWSWLLGGRTQPKEMQQFPVPDGIALDRDPDWYSAWNASAGSQLARDPICKDAVASYIKNMPGFSYASIDIDTITPVGFHSLVLTPLRIPMYLGAYMHPSRAVAFHFIMSAQNGEIHDGGDRPTNPVGTVFMNLFGGFFSK